MNGWNNENWLDDESYDWYTYGSWTDVPELAREIEEIADKWGDTWDYIDSLPVKERRK